MKKIAFKTKSKGMCPEYEAFGKRYYIQDRLVGGNYEYALMSVDLKMPEVLKFPDRRKLAGWLNGSKESVLDDGIADYIIFRNTLLDYGDVSLIEREGRKFVLEKREKEILIREYAEHIQETGWFPRYRECLDMAKKILSDMENKINGEQMTLQL